MKFLYISLVFSLLASCSAKWPGPEDGYTDVDYDCTGLESKCHGNDFMWCNEGRFVVINCESKGKICYDGYGCIDEIPEEQNMDDDIDKYFNDEDSITDDGDSFNSDLLSDEDIE